MKKVLISIGAIFIALTLFSSTAFSWGPGIHTLVNDREVGSRWGISNGQEMAGATAPDNPLTLLDEDPAFEDLVMKFVSELPDMLDKLNSNFQKKDWATLKSGLHNLKGMGGGFGYRVLTELAGKAEFQLFSENYEAAGVLLDEIGQVSQCIYEGVKLGGDNVVALKINSNR